MSGSLSALERQKARIWWLSFPFLSFPALRTPHNLVQQRGFVRSSTWSRRTSGTGKTRRRRKPKMDSSSLGLDLTPLKEALNSKAFDKIADICDEIQLQAASEGIIYPEDWPYAVHLLGHMFVQDLNSARFLWKCIPAGVKENQPEVVAAWKIGQRLWSRDYPGVHEALRGFAWSPDVRVLITAFSEAYKSRTFQLLTNAYSTIGVAQTARCLGMNEEDATKAALMHGWTLDSSLQMLTVNKMSVRSEQKLDTNKLQRLTEYVFQLEH